MSSPTDDLLRAAAMLEADAALGRAPRDEAIQAGVAASEAPLPPDARDAARRHLATSTFLYCLAWFESPERAEVLWTLAEGHSVAAAVVLDSAPRYEA